MEWIKYELKIYNGDENYRIYTNKNYTSDTLYIWSESKLILQRLTSVIKHHNPLLGVFGFHTDYKYCQVVI